LILLILSLFGCKNKHSKTILFHTKDIEYLQYSMVDFLYENNAKNISKNSKENKYEYSFDIGKSEDIYINFEKTNKHVTCEIVKYLPEQDNSIELESFILKFLEVIGVKYDYLD
jgi:hypothetical protein